MAKGSETIETTVRGFDETGNTLIAHLTLDVIDSNLNYFSTMDVTATFGFHDNVIESILMAYEATEADIAYLKKLKKLSGK